MYHPMLLRNLIVKHEKYRPMLLRYQILINGIMDKAKYQWSVVSGAIVSFYTSVEYALRKLVVTLLPQQDLHGYDSPWPAGGGKNKYPVLIGADSRSNYNGGTTENDNGTLVVNVAATLYSGCYLGTNSEAYEMASQATGQYVCSYYAKADKNMNVFIGFQAHGNNLKSLTTSWQRFTDAATFDGTGYSFNIYNGNTDGSAIAGTVQIKDLMFEAGSVASAYEPYSNICPITGHTEVNVWRTGVNVWDEETVVGNIVDATGENGTDTDRIRSKNYISVSPSTTYFAYYGGANYSWNIIVYQYDADKVYLGNTAQTRNVINSSTKTFTTVANCHYVRFQVHPSYGTTYNNDISINYPSTDHDYEPYTGSTISVTIPTPPGTVYSAQLDVVSGVLTVDKGIVTFTGQETWQGAGPFYSRLDDVERLLDYSSAIISNRLPTFTAQNASAFVSATDGVTAYASATAYPGQNWIYAKVNGISSPNDFKTWLASNNLQVCYPLATPQTYQLTPEEVESIANSVNNVWSDSGNVEVEYLHR